MAASSVGSGKGHCRIAGTQKRGSVVSLSGCVLPACYANNHYTQTGLISTYLMFAGTNFSDFQNVGFSVYLL